MSFFYIVWLFFSSLPQTACLLLDNQIVAMSGDGYKKLTPVRLISGTVLHPRRIYHILKEAMACDAYLSTPIAPNCQLDTTTQGNIAQAKKQQDRLEKVGMKVLNPANYPVKVPSPHWWMWSPTEVMVLWTLVLVMMSKKGKRFYYRKAHSEKSLGCSKELKMAETLGMTLICLDE